MKNKRKKNETNPTNENQPTRSWTELKKRNNFVQFNVEKSEDKNVYKTHERVTIREKYHTLCY